MLWRTHVSSGLFAGYLVSGLDPALLAASGIASLLPDMDHPNSYVGNKVPLVPTLTRMALGHRGALHSLLAAIALGMVFIGVWGKEFGMAVAAGYLAHLLGDVFTKSGVPLLWPLPLMVKVPLVRTGGLLERLVVFPVLTLGLGYWAVWPMVYGYVGRMVAWFR